jgi:hypothetical protein
MNWDMPPFGTFPDKDLDMARYQESRGFSGRVAVSRKAVHHSGKPIRKMIMDRDATPRLKKSKSTW